MPILNMITQGGGGGNIGEPLNLTVTSAGLDATIKWEDNEIGTIPPTTFQKSVLVRKIGSAPTSPSDGTLVVTETVKDTYKTIGYVDQGLTDGETYYYRVFSYSDLGGISYCDAVNVTPSGSGWQPGANTIGYRPLVSDLKDYSGNGYDLSYNGTVSYSQVGSATKNSYTSTGGSNMLYGTSVAGVPQGTNVSTQSCWFYLASNPQYGHDGTVFAIGTTNNNEIRTMFINGGSSTIMLSQWGSASSGYGLSLNTWYNIIMVYDGSAFKLYLNGNSSPVISWNYNVSTNGTNVYIMGDGNFGPYGTVGNVSNVILENKAWTTQEISDYFDLTKGDYGIS